MTDFIKTFLIKKRFSPNHSNNEVIENPINNENENSKKQNLFDYIIKAPHSKIKANEAFFKYNELKIYI